MTTSPPASNLLLGTICALGSAVGYTAANSCLRAVADCDAIWVSAMKAFPTVIFIGPWLLFRMWQGARVWPTPRVLALLTLAGVIGQLGGNVLFQWALGVIGIALTVPLCLGAIILGGAILGRLYLNEPLTARTLISVVLLITAIAVLSLGAGDAQRSVAESLGESTASLDWKMMVAGVVAATLSGLAYAILGVVIRYGVTGRASVAWTMFTVGIVGVVTLGGASLLSVGWERMLATAPDDFAIMLAAGFFNFLAFLLITKALQKATVVYVNSLNATQATMAAIAGVLFFHEALSAALALGVILTMAGLFFMRERKVLRK